MATITVDTFLDGGVARTANETWTMNGGVLTIRTDTRWHENAPASMTGSIGTNTISATLGGGVLLDATNVREIEFDTGSGTVPAIGTSVTQGGVSGYLLGVYANLTSAPTAVGAAMPSTGYIKFREVTGGSFAAGALSGISANALGADKTSWIEVVYDQARIITVNRLGFYRTRGDWYELGTTSGSAAQILQIPTNGGGAGTHVPGVWIETGAGTNQYEYYASVVSGFFTTTNLGTDVRSKIVETMGGGQIRIGSNGSANVGYVPPAGCKIRVPNIFLRQTTSVNRANNVAPITPTNRTRFDTLGGGIIDMEYVSSDWYHLYSSAYSVKLHNCAVFDTLWIENIATPLDIDNYGGSAHSGGQNVEFRGISAGGTIQNSKFYRSNNATNGHCAIYFSCKDVLFDNCQWGIVGYTRGTEAYPVSCSESDNLTFADCRVTNDGMRFRTSSNCNVTDLDYVDVFRGTTQSDGQCFIIDSKCTNITIDGLTFGLNGTIANTHPGARLMLASDSSNITLKNAGTAASPLNTGTVNTPSTIFTDNGRNNNIKIQRCYVTATSNNNFSTSNTSKRITIQDTAGTTGAVVMNASDSQIKGVRSASNSTLGRDSVYGSSFANMFYTDTTGGIFWAMNEPTGVNSDYVTLTLAGVKGGFTSKGNVSMPTLGDTLILETPYVVKGYTAFTNTTATLTGTNTGNFSYEFQIDTGSGYGAWTNVSGANLSALSISPSTGFRLKLKIICTTASTTNALTYVRLSMTTTLSAQQTNLYPLEILTPTLTITGLVTGTEVVLYSNTWVELDREVLSGTSYSYNYNWDSDAGNFDVNVLIWKDDKIPIKLNLTLTDENQSLPIFQVDDLVYTSGSTTPVTIDYTNTLLIMGAGVVEYSIPEVYSIWKDNILLSTNAQYDFAFDQLGGNTISVTTSIPFYTFLNTADGWRIRPDEADHTLSVTNGILVANNGLDPFVDTLGAFTVRINYQQPVQAIAVSTGGGGGITVDDIMTDPRALTTGKFIALK
jgi:hypothetical protein